MIDLDLWLGEDDVFDAPYHRRQEWLVESLRQSYRQHVANDPRYRAYAQRYPLTADGLVAATIDAIPLMPIGAFKRDSAAPPAGTVLTTSSGTQGTVSTVPRDDRTMMRFFASLSPVRRLLGLADREATWHILAPPAHEVDHLWVSYVLSGAALGQPHHFYGTADTMDVPGLARALLAESDEPEVIVGPPHVLLRAARTVERVARNPLRSVITVGGWKAHADLEIDAEEFREFVSASFGVRPDQIRDSYNMVELNSVIFECSHHRLHIPPWLRVTARDPRTLEPLRAGVGLLGFADPTPTSYPGFVLSEDFGAVDRCVPCACGIESDVLRFDRRVRGVEQRGCAYRI